MGKGCGEGVGGWGEADLFIFVSSSVHVWVGGEGGLDVGDQNSFLSYSS